MRRTIYKYILSAGMLQNSGSKPHDVMNSKFFYRSTMTHKLEH